YAKAQASTGGVAGNFDYFVTGSAQTFDGYREHSAGHQIRLNSNVGYQFSPMLETRFYLNATKTKQEIPGEVSKAQALDSPESANPGWVAQDQQRNVDSIRIANKTTARVGETTVDFGVFYNNRHVKHPIFQWLDYTVDDYGGFVRAVDERQLGGMRNRLIVGGNIHNGELDTEQFVNVGGQKGALASSYVDTSENVSLYAENSLYIQPNVALIAGVQYLYATRERQDRFLSNGDQSGSSDFDLWSPKIGVLWEINPDWQVFGNVSRSAEVPSYDTNNFAAASTSTLKAQTATTYEIGTRGQIANIRWDVSAYRADIEDELQCLTTGPFSACSPINADNTVHQGIEAGIDAAIGQSFFADGDSLNLTAAYTLNDFFFDGDALYGDNELPGVPKHYLRTELIYKHPQGFYAGPNVEWSPESYYADNANSLTVDSFTLLNFRIGYDAGSGWSAYLEGRNLSDEHYISTVAIAGTASPTSEIFNSGTGRSVNAGVRLRW
ncbi:MAG: TonB-dependent receptor, partial [Burkholderiales bacterium]